MISAVIITLNEEKNIRRCLESVKWMDEIIVLDSGSSDDTKRICLEYSAKVYERFFTDYSDQKNFAIKLASNEWIFSIDADEEMSLMLKYDIKSILRGDKFGIVFKVKRMNNLYGTFYDTYVEYPIRLFKRHIGYFKYPLHEVFEANAHPLPLESELYHYCLTDISAHIKNIQRYTNEFVRCDTRHRLRHLFIKPPYVFFKKYFFEKMYRCGLRGFVFSVLTMFAWFTAIAKKYEQKD